MFMIYAVYVVYAISSLDTEVSLRHRVTDTEHEASSGHNRELPGSLPGPARWEKRPRRIIFMAMHIAPACSSACTTGAHLCICPSSANWRADLATSDRDR